MNTQEITVDDFLKEIPNNSKFLKFEDGKTKTIKILTPLKVVKRTEQYKNNDEPQEVRYIEVYDYESKKPKLTKIGIALHRALKAGIEAYDNDFSIVDFKIRRDKMTFTAIPVPTQLKDISKIERLNIIDIFRQLDERKKNEGHQENGGF